MKSQSHQTEVCSVKFDDSGETIIEGYCHFCKSYEEASKKDFCRHSTVGLCDWDK